MVIDDWNGTNKPILPNRMALLNCRFVFLFLLVISPGISFSQETQTVGVFPIPQVSPPNKISSQWEQTGFIGYSSTQYNPQLLIGALVGRSWYYQFSSNIDLSVRAEVGVEWPLRVLNRVGFGLTHKFLGGTSVWLQSSLFPFVQGLELAAPLPRRFSDASMMKWRGVRRSMKRSKRQDKWSRQIFVQSNYLEKPLDDDLQRQPFVLRVGLRRSCSTNRAPYLLVDPDY